jgi:hypothetical protein
MHSPLPAGVRILQMWLGDDRALRDVLGHDYTFLDLRGDCETGPLEAAFRSIGAPRRVLRLDEPHLREVYRASVFLLRPDRGSLQASHSRSTADFHIQETLSARSRGQTRQHEDRPIDEHLLFEDHTQRINFRQNARSWPTPVPADGLFVQMLRCSQPRVRVGVVPSRWHFLISLLKHNKKEAPRMDDESHWFGEPLKAMPQKELAEICCNPMAASLWHGSQQPAQPQTVENL